MNRAALMVIIIAVVGGVWYYMLRQEAEAPAAVETAQTDANQPAAGAADASTAAATVIYAKQGFSPETVKIKAGQSVTFVNQSGGRMWVASDPHPTHEKYSGTTRSEHCSDSDGDTFDQCASGDSYTFTFTKKGTWKYHNHALSGDTGTVIVE